MSALVEADIPHRIVGELTLMERGPVKDALAYCALAVNPHNDNAFARILVRPTRHIGAPASLPCCCLECMRLTCCQRLPDLCGMREHAYEPASKVELSLLLLSVLQPALYLRLTA